MNVAVPPAPSGLSAVDRQWGGLAAGRTYLLVGRAGAGRSALAFQIVKAAVDDGTKCLVISPRAPEALVDVANGVGLDLGQAHRWGRLRLLRIPPAAELAKRGAAGLAKSYRDLVGLVEADRPGRVVIEDFTPLVQFDTFERFREAFSTLVSDLRDLDATLVVGLGDPANDASRHLLDVVSTLVDGTIQLSASGHLLLQTPPPAPSGALPEADRPEEAGAPPEADEAEATEPPVAEDEPESEEARSFEEEATPLASPEPPAESRPLASTNDGASVETDGPQPAGRPMPPPVHVAAPLDAGPPPTDVVPPPPVDPDLLLPSQDTFGVDPADAIMGQGFLADSTGGKPLAPALPASGVVPAFPLSPSQPFQLPPPAALPTFKPLGRRPAPSPADAFRAALGSAFEARAGGAGFLVVALRMEPEAPEAAHFPEVEAGLRSALDADASLLVDAERKRAIVLLPSPGPDAGPHLFDALQVHLGAALGDEAEAVLASIGAVTVPDGQPFTSAPDLMAYAFEG